MGRRKMKGGDIERGEGGDREFGVRRRTAASTTAGKGWRRRRRREEVEGGGGLKESGDLDREGPKVTRNVGDDWQLKT